MHRGLCHKDANQNSNIDDRGLVMYEDTIQKLKFMKQNSKILYSQFLCDHDSGK
jgi:hypothetical protein